MSDWSMRRKTKRRYNKTDSSDDEVLCVVSSAYPLLAVSALCQRLLQFGFVWKGEQEGMRP